MINSFQQLDTSFQRELALYRNIDKHLAKYDNLGPESNSSLHDNFSSVREILAQQVVFF